MAFAVGYYYGRAGGGIGDVTLAEHDIGYKKNQGFLNGLSVGTSDFLEVDLPAIALSQSQVDPL